MEENLTEDLSGRKRDLELWVLDCGSVLAEHSVFVFTDCSGIVGPAMPVDSQFQQMKW